MEILKIGDEFIIEGYVGITLTDDINANIQAFATANKLSFEQAKNILDKNAELQEFIKNSSTDDDEDIVITNFDLDESNTKTRASYDGKASASYDGKTVGNRDGKAVATNDGRTVDNNSKSNSSNNNNNKNTNSTTEKEEIASNGVRYILKNKKSNTVFEITTNGNTITFKVENAELEITSVPNNKIHVQTQGKNATFTFLESPLKITNTAESSTINAGDGKDNIINKGNNMTINGGAGDDTITNDKKATNVTINSGAGNDKITNNGEKTTIQNDAGNDKITNNKTGKNSKIIVTAGENTVTNRAEATTIQAEDGKNTITNYSSGKSTKIELKNGQNTVKNQAEATTISNNYGDAKITNSGKNAKITSNIVAVTITNSGANTSISTGSANDNITNTGANVVIDAGNGENTIVNKGKEAKITTGDHKDTITNSGASSVINAGNGENKIKNTGSSAKITTGDDNDTIENKGSKTTINTNMGKDNIINRGNNSVIDAGAGSDIITDYSSSSNLSKGTNDTLIKNGRNTTESVKFYDDADKISVPDNSEDDEQEDNTHWKKRVEIPADTVVKTTSNANTPNTNGTEKTTSSNDKTTSSNDKTTGSNDKTTSPEAVHATASSTNSNAIKNFLGFFGLDVNSEFDKVDYIDDQVSSIVVNGTTYSLSKHANGQPKEQTTQDAKGNKTTTTYFENGNISKETVTTVTETTPATKTVEEKIYDEKGFLVKTISTNYKGTDENADDYTETIKEYEARLHTADEKFLKNTIVNQKTNGEIATTQTLNKSVIAELNDAENVIINTTAEIIMNNSKRHYDSAEEKKLTDAIKKYLEEYKSKGSSATLIEDIARNLNATGYNTAALKKTIETANHEIIAIREATAIIDAGIANNYYKAATAPYVDPNKKIENTDFEGISFNITSENKTQNVDYKFAVLEDGTIDLFASNCTIDVLGIADSNKKIRISGKNVVFNSNAYTFETITNYAQSAIINGSFGNDNIYNGIDGRNSYINGINGDDVIVNKGSNSYIDGGADNDTIYNLVSQSTVTGNTGDDAINYLAGSTNLQAEEGLDSTVELSAIPDNLPITPAEAPKIFSKTGQSTEVHPGIEEPKTWKFSKTYTENGITFIAYSNTEVDISTKVEDDVLVINAKDTKIVITSTSTAEPYIRVEGDAVYFETNAKIKAVYNYAENSKITGSNNEEYIVNYADNVEIVANGGDDRIYNEGSNVKIAGNDGADFISNKASASNVTLADITNEDTLEDKGKNTTKLVLISAKPGTPEYNLEVASVYLEHAQKGTEPIFAETPSDEVLANANNLISNFFELTPNEDGSRDFSETAKTFISYIKYADPTYAEKSDIECLAAAIKEMDTDKTGFISNDEIGKFDKKVNPVEDLNNLLATSGALKLLELTEADVSTITKQTGCTFATLKLLKQVDVIIREMPIDYTIENIKDMLLNESLSFNDEILADAQILVDAKSQANPDAYIRSQMIKNGAGMDTATMLANTKVGEVIEKNNILYVNDNGKLVQLGISPKTYLELFPPVTRYITEQNSYNDCFFIATTMIDYMENDLGRANLLQMFKENKNGDITITIPGVSAYPITFAKGNLKSTDNKFNLGSTTYSYQTKLNEKGEEVLGIDVLTTSSETERLTNTTAAKGLQLLEQAYALAKFAQLSNTEITSDDIKELGEALYLTANEKKISAKDASNVDIDKALTYYLYGGYAQEVYSDLNPNGETDVNYRKIISTSQGQELLGNMAAELLDDDVCITTLISNNTTIPKSIADKYNIIKGHQYAIEKIDTINQIVYIKNPWDSYKITAIPYTDFLTYFYGFAGTEIA